MKSGLISSSDEFDFTTTFLFPPWVFQPHALQSSVAQAVLGSPALVCSLLFRTSLEGFPELPFESLYHSVSSKQPSFHLCLQRWLSMFFSQPSSSDYVRSTAAACWADDPCAAQTSTFSRCQSPSTTSYTTLPYFLTPFFPGSVMDWPWICRWAFCVTGDYPPMSALKRHLDIPPVSCTLSLHHAVPQRIQVQLPPQ